MNFAATKSITRQGDSQEQATLRLEKMQGAVRTLLECIGEDPGREGLLDTPSRYAKALLFFNKGYPANVPEVVNNALFHECHKEMVIVRDIDICSLCEHHLVAYCETMLWPKEEGNFPPFPYNVKSCVDIALGRTVVNGLFGKFILNA